MSRSSIFSFDTLRLTGLRPYGAIFAIALLVAVEVFVARGEMVWSFAQNSQPGIVDAMEHLVIDKAENPQIVVLGDSRDRDAIVPGVLARELGIPSSDVLNLSLTSGLPFDSLTLYRRNREHLSQAKLIILGVDDFSLRPLTDTERVRRFATLRERWEHFEGETRASLIVGFIWRTFDANKAIGRLMKQVLLRPDRRVAIGEDGRVVWRDENAGFVDDAEQMAIAWYGKGEKAFNSWAVRELLDLAKEDGVPVLLYRAPLSEKFREHRDRLQPHANQRFKDHLAQYADHPAVVGQLVNDDPAAFGLSPDDFFDYGHPRASGAEKTTKALADEIRRLDVIGNAGSRDETSGSRL
jgi:hypothetical protein